MNMDPKIRRRRRQPRVEDRPRGVSIALEWLDDSCVLAGSHTTSHGTLVQRSVGEVVEALPDPPDRERLECREDETRLRSCGYNADARGAAQKSPP